MPQGQKRPYVQAAAETVLHEVIDDRDRRRRSISACASPFATFSSAKRDAGWLTAFPIVRPGLILSYSGRLRFPKNGLRLAYGCRRVTVRWSQQRCAEDGAGRSPERTRLHLEMERNG